MVTFSCCSSFLRWVINNGAIESDYGSVRAVLVFLQSILESTAQSLLTREEYLPCVGYSGTSGSACDYTQVQMQVLFHLHFPVYLSCQFSVRILFSYLQPHLLKLTLFLFLLSSFICTKTLGTCSSQNKMASMMLSMCHKLEGEKVT